MEIRIADVEKQDLSDALMRALKCLIKEGFNVAIVANDIMPTVDKVSNIPSRDELRAYSKSSKPTMDIKDWENTVDGM